MHKSLVFGNHEAFNVDNNTKNYVIDYLYNNVDLSKYRFNILNNISKLNFLKENEHYVSPNYKGYNYLLLFLIINNKNKCFVIDRKKLSYHKNQLDIKNVNILSININISDNIYEGTIFDGKFINKNNIYYFLIQDCFLLMNKKMINIDLDTKINNINNIFNIFDNSNKNVIFKLNRLYTYDKLKELINNLSTLQFESTGLVFYPKKSGINIIFVEKKQENITFNNDDKINQESYNLIHNYVDFLKSRTYTYEENGKTKALWLSRTNIPDVYNICEKENDNKIGIASIPNLKISQICDNTIADKPIKFNCIYCNKFKKWIPLNPI